MIRTISLILTLLLCALTVTATVTVSPDYKPLQKLKRQYQPGDWRCVRGKRQIMNTQYSWIARGHCQENEEPPKVNVQTPAGNVKLHY